MCYFSFSLYFGIEIVGAKCDSVCTSVAFLIGFAYAFTPTLIQLMNTKMIYFGLIFEVITDSIEILFSCKIHDIAGSFFTQSSLFIVGNL